ncbi:hypothetical protein [Chryseobacterium mucoviscidosis]|uniref:hypothetical protein n=1 Tax=Chryseobacterium mucoviscidosis TaxID=1945581 RepID=UPI0031CED13C
MGRNYSFLILLFVGCFLCNCTHQEFPDDLPDYPIPLNEAVGIYIYVPHKDETFRRDDYKYLDLRKGDTLKLEIKSDSSFTFNYFYHDKAIKTKRFTGKFIVSPTYKDILIFKNYPDGSQYIGGTSGFKKGQDIYFYLRLKSPTDNSEYEYNLYYKKVK